MAQYNKISPEIAAALKAVAVDRNPDAQIFNYCDYGIVGDMDEVCDEMISQLTVRKGD